LGLTPKDQHVTQAKIPATVITGFLGAGKTSMIRSLLGNANGKRIALIINEFGDLGVDGEILKSCGFEGCEEDDIVELANGCICCTVADDFLPTIKALLARPEPPDHIVIETSGLALPKPLVKAFNWPDIRTRVTVDGVITVVDAPAVAAGMFAHDPDAVQGQREADDALDHDSPLEELFEEQLGCADMVVLNKMDLINEAALAQVIKDVKRETRRGVRIVRATNGEVDAAVLLGIGAMAEDDLDSRKSHLDDAGEHDHDDFTSFHVELGDVTDPVAFVDHVRAVVHDHEILRVKGFAHVTGKDMRLLVQGVGGRIAHYFDRDWKDDERRVTRLVIIAETGIDEAAIRAALAA
jgi:cobalamin biosynthesis protein CobW